MAHNTRSMPWEAASVPEEGSEAQKVEGVQSPHWLGLASVSLQGGLESWPLPEGV